MYPSKKFRGYVISKTACEGGFKKKSCPRGAKNQANAALFETHFDFFKSCIDVRLKELLGDGLCRLV